MSTLIALALLYAALMGADVTKVIKSRCDSLNLAVQDPPRNVVYPRLESNNDLNLKTEVGDPAKEVTP